VAVFLAAAGFLMAALLFYTLTHRRPLIPRDADHEGVEPARCLECHGPGRDHARGPNHPLNDQCFSCHDRG